MKTYLLKYIVRNNIDFPKGTVVKVNDWMWEFEVVEGQLKGEKGNLADGMDGWLLANTVVNKQILRKLEIEKKKLEDEITAISKQWDDLETETEA